MKPIAIRDAVKQFGLWLLLVLVVAVCTLLFNILGVISTSVLAGVIMAAYRRWKWQVLPVSLVFPIVGLALARISNGGLESRQRTAMVALCFGAFWGIYVPALWLIRMEKPASAQAEKSAGPATAHPAAGQPAPEARLATLPTFAGVLALESPKVHQRLSLQDFEGTWFCQMNGPNGEFRTGLMAVSKDRFELEIRNERGVVREVTEGRIKLNEAAVGLPG